MHSRPKEPVAKDSSRDTPSAVPQAWQSDNRQHPPITSQPPTRCHPERRLRFASQNGIERRNLRIPAQRSQWWRIRIRVRLQAYRKYLGPWLRAHRVRPPRHVWSRRRWRLRRVGPNHELDRLMRHGWSHPL